MLSVLVGRSEGKRTLRKSGLRLEDNIKMDLTDIRWEGMGWFSVVQVRDRWRRAVMNAVMKLRVPKNAGNFLTT
jgi:hypothetical protein